MKNILKIILLLTLNSTVAQSVEIIPFTLTEFNNIKVKAILNKKDTINMTFDTGATDFYLTKEAIKRYLNPDNLQLTMNDINDESFKIGNLEWNNQQIYPIIITGQKTDGMFGWNMFEGKIIEIDYDKQLMIVYNKLPKISKEYEKFEMEILKEHFLIHLELMHENQKYKSKFLFDTGFQKALMLDNDLLTKMDFPTKKLQIIKSTILRNSNNDEIRLETVKLPILLVGKYSLKNIPSELNNSNNPAGYATNHLGSDILKKFNIILDFQNKYVYLKPNKYMNEKYFDERNKS